MFKIKKYFKTCFNHNIILLIFILFSCTKEGNSPNNYFFTLYPSHNNKTSYIIHSITPYSKHLTFDLSQEDYSKMIKSDSTGVVNHQQQVHVLYHMVDLVIYQDILVVILQLLHPHQVLYHLLVVRFIIVVCISLILL